MNRRQGLVVFVTFALYLVIGGSVFMTLENSRMPVQPTKSVKLLNDFVDMLKVNSDDVVNITSNEDWNEYVSYVYVNFTESMESNGTSKQWTLYDGVFLCLTVVTTIGYGNISPTTGAGRVFCVLYGFIGIPMAGILFAGIGDFFSNKLLKAHEKTKSRSSSPRRALIISTIMYLIPGFLMFLFLPAGIFMILEKWTFLEGFYYSFVTLTTIGFGDYVAGTESGELQWIYKVCLMLWITFGLGYLAMILNFIAKAMKSKHVKKIEKTVSKNLRQTQEAFTKEMEYVLRTMNEFYTNKIKVKNSTNKLKRTSSCPSLDRPGIKVKRSNSTGSLSDIPPESPFGQPENPANFIFDLAMALACGDIHEPNTKESEEVIRSRTGSIAQILTMALIPPPVGSRVPSEANFSRERSSTRRSLPPLHDILLKNTNSMRAKNHPQIPIKTKKSVSLLEGLLFPPETNQKNLKNPFMEKLKRRQSDRCLADADVTLGGSSRFKENHHSGGLKLSRSISNPGSGTFRYLDRFMDRSNNSSFSTTDRSEQVVAPSSKCKWIVGSSSMDDVTSMVAKNHEETEKPKQISDNHHSHHTLQRIPSIEGPHIKLTPSIPVIFRPENEMSTVIEEDNETSSQGSITNLSSIGNSSEQGISSQETISIDIAEPDTKSDSTCFTDDKCQEDHQSTSCTVEIDPNAKERTYM